MNNNFINNDLKSFKPVIRPNISNSKSKKLDYAIQSFSEKVYLGYDDYNKRLCTYDYFENSNWNLKYKEVIGPLIKADILRDDEDTILSYDSQGNVIYYEDYDISGKWILEGMTDNIRIIRTAEDINKALTFINGEFKICDITYEDNQKFRIIKKV